VAGDRAQVCTEGGEVDGHVPGRSARVDVEQDATLAATAALHGPHDRLDVLDRADLVVRELDRHQRRRVVDGIDERVDVDVAQAVDADDGHGPARVPVRGVEHR